MPKRILVFPCGSEIGLEIHRSMSFSRHFELVGASSVDDHGKFVYKTYVGNVPMHNASEFARTIARLVTDNEIDAIYPTMDAVAETLQDLGDKGELPCRVIGSDRRATSICASKKLTYGLLEGSIPTPKRYLSVDDTASSFPIFIKPDRGYGARNCILAETPQAAKAFLAQNSGTEMLLQEYLPGQEWTIDCFSDRHGKLRFHAARGRNRISNGISVNTSPSEAFSDEFSIWANSINKLLKPRGAWFFQAKQDAQGSPRLLEVAARLGGSSGVFRCQGVNFALLSAFDAFEQEVSIAQNTYHIEMDRALASSYKIKIEYNQIFVDLDDCLILRGRINHQLVCFLYKSINDGKSLTLLTRHHRDPRITLRELRISELFDKVIHLSSGENKSDYIDRRDSIFIDDSFAERQDVARKANIPAFSPEMVEALL
ncbi:ATP-grasp domain-containing protein [Ferribacterium limneticum]|uniref:ATP-grasp domain-containing protein n=1 Tax=Ferribacterium limneticum TaxID=76259 RepID=UPI001CFBCB30|nr:ATP-grasp domain-containing protein [Ferribacterium limneticum]UCV19780.1 ATP-grasp domain-containing protein [Ferribacterium limneticum]